MIVKKQKPLTPKQKQVFDFICKFINKHEYPPSLQEIGKFFKKSISTAQHHVDELLTKGYLKREEHLARGIAPVSQDSDKIPLLGYIAAGEPIEPLENPESISVPASTISPSSQYYALRVKGNSMMEDGILDKDIVIIKHQFTAEPGETVVAITEKGATLKIFRKRSGKIFLEPRNKNLENIYPKELEIRGKFVGLIRKGY